MMAEILNFLDMNKDLNNPGKLVEMIRDFPTEVTFTHCGVSQRLSPFTQYGKCEQCGTTVKLWGFSAETQIHDVFDAFFQWLLKDGAAAVVRQRQGVLRDDTGDGGPAVA